MNPIQKLDIVLAHLNENKEKWKGPRAIKDALRLKEIILEYNETNKILKKLVKDGYAEIYENNLAISDIEDAEFIITFEGELFYKANGYAQKYLDEKLQREKTESETKAAKLNTIVTTISSIIAAITGFGLVIWEIYKAVIKE